MVHLGPLPRVTTTFEDPGLGIDGRPFLLAIGTFERRKSLTTLVAAFGQLADTLGDSLLVMAGAPGDDSDRIAAAVEALPASVRSRVICPGRVTDNAKGWLLKRSSVLVYPSLDEGFGFPILEAQIAGDTGRRQPCRRRYPRSGATAWCSSTETIPPRSRRDRTGRSRRRVCGSGWSRPGSRNVSRFTWDRTAAVDGGAVPARHRRSIVQRQ